MVDNSSYINASVNRFTCHDPSIFLQAQTSLHANYIIAAIFNTVFSFAAFFGNAIILAALRTASSINRATNALLCSLALSDFMVGLVVQPSHVIYCIYGVIGGPQVRCYSRTVFQYTSDYFVAISFLTIVAITLDRYLTLCHRHTYRSVVTPGKLRGMIAFVWIICLSFPLGRLVSPSTPMILSSVVFIVFLVIPSFAVCKIYRFLKQHQLQLSSRLKPQTVDTKKVSSFSVSQYKRSVITMMLVYLALFLCFLPSVGVTAAWVTADQLGKLRLIRVGNFSLTVLMLNSSINPFLYYWRIPEVRRLTGDLFKKLFRCFRSGFREKYSFYKDSQTPSGGHGHPVITGSVTVVQTNH